MRNNLKRLFETNDFFSRKKKTEENVAEMIKKSCPTKPRTIEPQITNLIRAMNSSWIAILCSYASYLSRPKHRNMLKIRLN